MEIQHLKKSWILRAVVVALLFGLLTWGFLLRFKPFQPEEPVGGRDPAGASYLYDHAHLLREISETANAQLVGIKKKYGIEGVIVTVVKLPPGFTIESLAVEMFNKWNIGGQTGGRGFLLLFSEKEKQMKLELSDELEDVFTDKFCGYIEGSQLKPIFLKNQLADGMVAVLEEIRKRARIKYQEKYNSADIEKLDSALDAR
jgi:uncharacterized protein